MKRDKPGKGRQRLVVRVMLTLVPLVILAGGGHYLLLQRMEAQWRDFSEEFRRVALPERSNLLSPSSCITRPTLSRATSIRSSSPPSSREPMLLSSLPDRIRNDSCIRPRGE